MKALKNLPALLTLLVLTIGLTAKAQYNDDERLNLPGDNLNLYAVMKLFQESETLEGFERDLNAEDSKINNLDLNGDNRIDYIKVIDYVDGETHSIVLQVAVTARENQDVAVFTVYKDSRGNVQVQLVGDEYLYGKDYIIEPYYADGNAETPNPGYAGDTRIIRGETVVIRRTTYVEVQTWPVIRYIYLPTYVVWHSPWYWGYYPAYWNPWRPYYWDYYYGYHSHWHYHYYGYYRHCSHYRYPRYHDYYYHGHRAHSATVRSHRESGRYRDTYSRPDLRKEGSAAFVKRHGNEGRNHYRSDIDRSGRTGRDIKAMNERRSSESGVNSRSSKPVTRESSVRSDSKYAGRSANERSVRTTENNRSPKQAVREAPARADNRSATRPENNRTIERDDNKRSVQPESNTYRQPERRTATARSGEHTGMRQARDGRTQERPAITRSSDNREAARTPGRSEVSRPSGKSEVSRPAGRSEVGRNPGGSTRQQSVAPSRSGHSQPQGRSASQGSSKSSNPKSGSEKRGNGR